jgi:transcriptional regulator with XRE-family HTH domain
MIHSMAKSTKQLSAREVFARNVRRVRRWKEMSQEALALEAGLSRPYLGEIERATRSVSIDLMGQIAAALEVPLRDLVDPNMKVESTIS